MHEPMEEIQEQKDYELPFPPSDSVSALEFMPSSKSWNGICAGSWDQSVRVWEVQSDKAVDKLMKPLDGIPLDAAWHGSGAKVFLAETTGAVLDWDMESNKLTKVGAHKKGARTCHWAENFLMTTSWDKTVKFWDPRCPVEVAKKDLPERSFAADVFYPMAVVACADQSIVVYELEKGPIEKARITTQGPKNVQVRSLAIFEGAATNYKSLFIAQTNGIVLKMSLKNYLVQYPMKCHRSTTNFNTVDIHAVNDVKINKVTKSMVTVGSDGTYSFWDCELPSKLKKSHVFDQPITKCSISDDGQILAYALGYDWAQGYENFDPKKSPQIFLRSIGQEMVPKYQCLKNLSKLK
ncbi:protein Rae1 [Drosophila ficusphila]|uniref:protein Rae1 n=1 Tax=Drosophila ficusphila TaxID=30025 RepID=UPI0007E76A06|nr:protein Rae1 [Drosophila ficusphila]